MDHLSPIRFFSENNIIFNVNLATFDYKGKIKMKEGIF